MSSPEGFGTGGPFGAGPLADLMRNLTRLLSSQGPVNWEIARQMAQWAAAGGQPESNPDPLSRARLEELIRVAELHVSEATGLQVGSGTPVSVRAVTPTEWALRTLDSWRSLLERLATKMASTFPSTGGGPPEPGWSPGEAPSAGQPQVPGDPAGSADPIGRLFADLPQVLAPFLFGLQAGSVVGQLASRAMGQYDLPIPRPPGDELLMVPSAIDRFAADWSLPPDDVRMWICLREALHHAVLARPHVHRRLEELIGRYVDAFEPSPTALEDRLGNLDPSDIESLQDVFTDPVTILGDLQNDAQREIQVPLRSLLAVVSGYADHLMDIVGRRLISSYGPLTEALRRRRLEESSAASIFGQLFGVGLDPAGYERGGSFVRGVVDRAGEDALVRLWSSERELPTPAELSAPGLWLARLEVDEPGGPAGSD